MASDRMDIDIYGVVTTNHAKFDYALIKPHAGLIVDSRGVYREPAGQIIKA